MKLADRILMQCQFGEKGTPAQWGRKLPPYTRQAVWKALNKLARQGRIHKRVLCKSPRIVSYGPAKRCTPTP